ncbi:MAG: futalosine hydrolase [Myxococcales bacterium]|nr:futalosine hydrolase [Myxococcales bacterium]
MLLVHAAEVEGQGLARRLRAWARGGDVALAAIGVGKVAACAGLVEQLAARRPAAVVLFGICGVYPPAHGGDGPALEVGDVCLVGRDQLADEGVEHERGFTELARLGFPVTGPFTADPELTVAAAAALGVPAVDGATVSTCSGTDGRSRALATRAGARVESMEGAAVAYVCQRRGIPMVQLRAVSNRTGDRARGGWDLKRAVAAVQDAVVELVTQGVLRPHRSPGPGDV